jgi:hypothetical protein
MPPIQLTQRSKLILDNHSAPWLAKPPVGRFQYTFMPTHGSWLNLNEGFFSRFARSVLRHIRVEGKDELKDRLMPAMDSFHQAPVVRTCVGSTGPGDMIRNTKSMD